MAIRTAPNRFAASVFPTELVVGIASYLDLRSLGALARTDNALYIEITTKPLLYIRIKAQLAPLPLPLLSDQSSARLTRLSEEFLSRRLLRPSTVNFGGNVWALAKDMPPLTSLQLIAQSSPLALHKLDGKNGESLTFLLTRALPTRSWNSNHAAAMDAHSALLRAIGEAIRKDPKQAGIPDFIRPVAKAAKEFIVQCLKQNAEDIDKAKFHLLVGEWLRTCARAANWDTTQLKQTGKLEYSHYALLHPLEWEQIFALATSPRLKKLCYLDLTNHDELKPGWDKPEPAPESTEGKCKKLDQMPVWEAMETLAENFEYLLGDLSDASGKTLAALLERASFPQHWDNLAQAFDAHAKLLRSMCPILFSAHHDKRKKLLADFSASLTNGLGPLTRIIHHRAGRLDKNELAALHRMLGELLRTQLLASPSSERTEKRLNARHEPCFGNTGLIDRKSWDAMLRLVLSRTKEPLTYLDLKNEEDSGDAKAKEPENNDSDDSDLDESDVTGKRYKKEKCTLS